MVELGGTIVRYEWDFDNDGTYDALSQTTSNVRHVYPTASTYRSTIRVTSDTGYSSTDTVTIVVEESPPTAMAQAGPIRGNAPLAVQLNGSGIDADGTIVKYEWDFDSNGTVDYTSAATGATAPHL